MRSIEQLFLDPTPLEHSSDKDHLFVVAMREAIAHHRQHSPEYNAICQREGFTEEALQTPEDLAKIPFIFVNVFKEYKLLSVPEDQIVLSLTSSGTTSNKRSQNYWDEPSLARLNQSVQGLGRQIGLYNPEPTNYLISGYNPLEAQDVGTAWSDENIRQLTDGAHRVEHMLHKGPDGEFHYDLEGSLNILEEFAKEGLPVRFIGFPSFIHFTLKERIRRQLPPLKLHAHSAVITGGGWKNHKDEEISHAEFCQELVEQVGMPADRIRDIYGLVEHGIPYFTCAHGQFHVPTYSRILIRRPGTLEVLPPGEKGLMQIISPYMNSVPTISLLTSDYATVLPTCTCGMHSPVLKLLGRGGVTKHKGCAIKAAEILGRT